MAAWDIRYRAYQPTFLVFLNDYANIKLHMGILFAVTTLNR